MTTREERQWSIAQRLYVYETQPDFAVLPRRERVLFFRNLKRDIAAEAEDLYNAAFYDNACILFTNALRFTEDLLACGDDIRFKDDKPLLFKRIQCLLKMGYYADAVKDCDTVLSHEPTYNHVRVDKAQALFALGHAEQCMTTLNHFTPQQRENNSRIAALVDKLKQFGYYFWGSTQEATGIRHNNYHSVDDISASWNLQGAKPKYTKKKQSGKKKQKGKQKSKKSSSGFNRKRSGSTNDIYTASTRKSDEDDEEYGSDTSIASEISESELAQSKLKNSQSGQFFDAGPRERSDPIQIPLPSSSVSGADAGGIDSIDDIGTGDWSTKTKRRRNTSGHGSPKNSPKNGSQGNNTRGNITNHHIPGEQDVKKNNAPPPSNTSSNNALISEESKKWAKDLNLKLACRNCFSTTANYGRIGHVYMKTKNHNCLKDFLICPDTVASQIFNCSIWCRIRDRVNKKFTGQYKLCNFYQSDKPCKVPTESCIFPHTSKEIVVWNAERKGEFNRNEVVLYLKLEPVRSKNGAANVVAGSPNGRHQSQRGVVLMHSPVTAASAAGFHQPGRTMFGAQHISNNQKAKFPDRHQQHHSNLPISPSIQTNKTSTTYLPLPTPVPPSLFAKPNRSVPNTTNPSINSMSTQQFPVLGSPINGQQSTQVPIIHERRTFKVEGRQHLLEPSTKENQRLKAASQQSALVSALLSKVKGCFTYICQQCRYSKPPCISYQNSSDPGYCGHPFSRHQWSECKILAHQIIENGRIRYSFIRPKLPNNVPNNCRHYFRAYGCSRGDTCNFAHDAIELEVWKLERTHGGINRDFLVAHCRFTETTINHPITPVRVSTPDVTQNKQPTTCPFTLKFVCGTCWSRGGQQQEKSSKNPMTCGAGHAWKDKICLMFNEFRRKWSKVNGRHPDLRPNITPAICKREGKCDYGNTHGKQCMFCHSEEERKLWIFMGNHKFKTLEEVVEGKNTSNNEQRSSATVKHPQRVSTIYHCSYCEMDFNSVEHLNYHISTNKHKQCVDSDAERSWNHRSPPLDVVNGRYVMCDRHKENRCPYSEADPANNPCTKAHNEDELEEWKERHQYRIMKRHKAMKSKLFSFMDELLIKYNLSTSEVTVITEKELPGIRIKCDEKLNSFISAIERNVDRPKEFQQSWTFEVDCVDGEKRLKRVGLLYDEHRLHFFLSHPHSELSPQVCPGSMIADGNTYSIDVKFASKMLGSFHQWVVFDFGSEPVLVRKLSIHVGAEGDRPKFMKQLSAIESTIIWDTSNTEILRPTIPELFEESLFQKYKPPSANLNIDDLNVGILSRENYKHRMHKMVSLEERDRMKTINRFNTTTDMHISNNITIEAYAGSELFIAQKGELYGKIVLTETLNCDSESSQLIMESVKNILCKFDSESNQAHELQIVSDETIDGRTKDHIYVHLYASCVKDLKLEADTTKTIEVQFQLNRFPFCQMHFAIDSLEHMEAVLPTPGYTLDIPRIGDREDQELNWRQEQAIQYMCLAGSSKVKGPPLVIYGPFGTGKTLTIATSVKRILRRHDTKVLICTMSNSGADLYIMEHLNEYLETYSKRGPKPTLLRVYQPKRRLKTVDLVVRKYCLIDENTMMFTLPTKEDVVRSRIVICTLNMTLHLARLNLKGHFTHILIDEAGQALESQAIMPLTMADWKTCIAIAGDHIQMSPKVYSEVARIGGFNISILQRLYEHYRNTRDENSILLHFNYRTCQEILSFVSDMYYKTRLISKKYHPPYPKMYPLSFYAVRGQDHLVGTSYLNRDEVVELGFRVEDLCRNWPSEWGEKIDIGVVTPYNSQVREIRQELRRRKLNHVTVEGVRNVQGKEFRALFISVVRTRLTLAKTHVTAKQNDPDESAEFYYGFLSDEKLLNTAFTRAKSHLVIVGDPIAMCSIGRCSKVWENFLQRCERHGSLYPQDITLQRIRGEIEAVKTQLNPFAAPFKPTANTGKSDNEHPLGILKHFDVASKTPELSYWQKPSDTLPKRQISEDYPPLSTIDQVEEETYVSSDFTFFPSKVGLIQETEEWQSEDEEEIDVKKIDDSILKELRRHVLQERNKYDISLQTDVNVDKSDSSSGLNEAKVNNEMPLKNLEGLTENDSGDSDDKDNENDLQLSTEEIEVEKHLLLDQNKKDELEEIVKMIFVPERDQSKLQGADFFDEYDPDTDTSSEELDQEASEEKYKPLLESEPEKYKRCKFHLDVRGKVYATTLEDDVPGVISIMSKYNRGRALNNDEVIVEIQQNEDVLEEIKPEDENLTERIYGRVVHVLRRATDPYLRKVVCTLDPFSNNLMVPVNRTFPKLCMPKTENRNKSSVENTIVAIYNLNKDGKFLFDRNVVVTNKDRRQKLFVVRYWKWHSKMTYPLGFVTEELEPGNTMKQGLHILKLVHGVEDTWRRKVREELDDKFPEAWTIPDEEITKRNDFRDLETFTIDPKDCQDIDDAISIRKLADGHFEIGVHIADVSFFVAKDSLLDNDAQKRATSYYPVSTAPVNMLPKRLSNDLCSLKPGKDRLAISVFMDISKDGLHCVTNTNCTQITKTVIRSRRKFTYAEVEDVIYNRHNETDIKRSIVDGLHKLNELAQKSRAARLKDGRYCYNVDDGEEDVDCPYAHSLIEEFMILANKAVAQYLIGKFSQCVPLRRQLPPDPEKLQEFQLKHLADIRNSKLMSGKFQDYINKSQCNCNYGCICGVENNTITMQTRDWNQLVTIVNDIEQGTDASPADMMKIISIICNDNRHPKLSVMMTHYYMIQEKSDYICSGQSISGGLDLGHYSLEVDFYTHFTSPIRRYVDIVVHRLIDAAIQGKPTPYTEEDISSICYHSTIESSNAKIFENKTKTLMMALQLKDVPLAYLPALEQTSDRRISFVFPMSFMPTTQRSVGLNYLKPLKRPDVNEDEKSINLIWKQRIYDAKAPPDEVLPKKMDNSTWELDAQRFSVTFNSDLWKDLLSGIEDEDIHQIRAAMYFAAHEIENAEKEKKKRNLISNQDGKLVKKEITSEILDRHGNRCHFVEFQRKYAMGNLVEVKLSAGFQRGLLEPRIQLFNFTPELDICLEHRSEPITCFSQLATKKPRGANGVNTYKERWLAVLSMSSAFNAVSEDDTIIIRNVTIVWYSDHDDSDNHFYHGVFRLSKTFCTDRSIRFNGMIFNKKDPSVQDEEGCHDYLCVRYPGLDVPPSSFSRSRSDVKTTWVGHCYTTKVCEDESKTSVEIYVRLNQSATELPQSVLHPKPGKHPLCTIELISKGMSDVHLEEALKHIDKLKPSLNRDIVLFRKHKMGGRENDSTAKLLPQLAKEIKVGQIHNIALPPPNAVQIQAIRTGLTSPFTVIQGPPGTGKTVTGAQLAYYFSEMNKKVPPTGKGTPQVLYCGPSNKSVDVVAGYLKKFPELPIVRVYSKMIEKKDFPIPWEQNIGSKTGTRDVSTDPKHVNIALHHLIRSNNNPHGAEIRNIERMFNRTRGADIPLKVRKHYKDLILFAKGEELKKNRIILATCNATGAEIFGKYCSIIQCIIDEAGMCSEPESLIPLVMCLPYQIVLIGDHKQLRPIITEKNAEEFGMGTSLLERYESKALMLTLQYRMHSSICEFPSSAFYDNRLETADSVKNRKGPNFAFWPAGPSRRTVFCHVYGKEETLTVKSAEGNEESKSNPHEISHVVRIACKLLEKGIKANNIIILSQYRLQCQRIRDALKECGKEDILVSTVVLSQGSEWDYVIMSTVRSLPRVEIEKKPSIRWMKMNMGFITDENQMNVALTRAKQGLILIGNQYLLQAHKTWNELLKKYKETGCLIDPASNFKP